MAEWSEVQIGDKVTLTRGGDDWEISNTFVVAHVHVTGGGLTALVAPGANYHWEDVWETLQNHSAEERERGSLWKIVEEHTVLITRYVKANSDEAAVRVRGEADGQPILYATDLDSDDYEVTNSALVSVEKVKTT